MMIAAMRPLHSQQHQGEGLRQSGGDQCMGINLLLEMKTGETTAQTCKPGDHPLVEILYVSGPQEKPLTQLHIIWYEVLKS
jgi:hypothetical protein